jgi:hypothetical protein
LSFADALLAKVALRHMATMMKFFMAFGEPIENAPRYTVFSVVSLEFNFSKL